MRRLQTALFSFAHFDHFQENIGQGLPNDWHCRAGGRFLYICEDGLVHYCSQQRGRPAFRSIGTQWTISGVRRLAPRAVRRSVQFRAFIKPLCSTNFASGRAKRWRESWIGASAVVAFSRPAPP